MENNQYNCAPQDQRNGFQQPPFITPQPQMDLKTAIITCFQNYANFNGRATRAEFWWWTLFCFLVSIATGLIPFIGWLISVALFIPSVAVAWRRLHDIGKAGGWWFLGFIPLVGFIILIIWYCKESEPMDNRFGPYLG